MIFQSLGILPYYKLEKTSKDKMFFFNNIGYYNFWDEFLILNSNVEKGIYHVIVNRTNKNFKGNKNISLKDEMKSKIIFLKSLKRKCPIEIFKEFPELNDLRKEMTFDGE